MSPLPETIQGDHRMKKLALPLVLAALALPGIAAADEALAKKNNCLKCHAVDKKKDGPSFQETAKKYKGKADAEAKLVSFITKPTKIKVDGQEEEHATVKSKDVGEATTLVKWILSR
jgi:cytochrome c